MKLLMLLTVIVSVGIGFVVSPTEAQQGRPKRDESTSGYPLNYFTGSDDYASGDIEVSHEQYRPTADGSSSPSLADDSARQNNNDQIMSTTIDSHQSVFDVSSSSEIVESFYAGNHENLRNGKLVLPTTSSTNQKSNAQTSDSISADRDVIRLRNTNSDEQSRPCDVLINGEIVNYEKLGNKVNGNVAETSDINVDVSHDVFETTTSNQGGLLMGIIYQGKLQAPKRKKEQ